MKERILKIKINLDNAAFDSGHENVELRDILQDMADRLFIGQDNGFVKDSNGNYCGWYKIVNEEAENER